MAVARPLLNPDGNPSALFYSLRQPASLGFAFLGAHYSKSPSGRAKTVQRRMPADRPRPDDDFNWQWEPLLGESKQKRAGLHGLQRLKQPCGSLRLNWSDRALLLRIGIIP